MFVIFATNVVEFGECEILAGGNMVCRALHSSDPAVPALSMLQCTGAACVTFSNFAFQGRHLGAVLREVGVGEGEGDRG